MQQQFFPASDRTELVVDLTLPQSASIHASADVTSRLEATLRDDPDIARWSSYIGRGAIRFYLPLNVQLPNPFFAQLVIVAKDLPARERLHQRLEQRLRQLHPYELPEFLVVTASSGSEAYLGWVLENTRSG